MTFAITCESSFVLSAMMDYDIPYQVMSDRISEISVNESFKPHLVHHTGEIFEEEDGITHRVSNILIDEHSDVNLIPEEVACEMLLLQRPAYAFFPTPTGEEIFVNFVTSFPFTLAGVTVEIGAYVVPVPPTFPLLLGSNWLKQVKNQLCLEELIENAGPVIEPEELTKPIEPT